MCPSGQLICHSNLIPLPLAPAIRLLMGRGEATVGVVGRYRPKGYNSMHLHGSWNEIAVVCAGIVG